MKRSYVYEFEGTYIDLDIKYVFCAFLISIVCFDIMYSLMLDTRSIAASIYALVEQYIIHHYKAENKCYPLIYNMPGFMK